MLITSLSLYDPSISLTVCVAEYVALGYRRAQVGSIAAGEVVQLVQLCVSYAGYFAGLGQPKPNVTPVTIAVNHDVLRQE